MFQQSYSMILTPVVCALAPLDYLHPADDTPLPCATPAPPPIQLAGGGGDLTLDFNLAENTLSPDPNHSTFKLFIMVSTYVYVPLA